MVTNLENYPSHLSDHLRQKIAIEYAQHEFRKLLPGLHDAALWQTIDAEIAAWPELLSVANFWNGIHGISMGFRLKSMVPLITSLHVRWSEKEIPVSDLWFGGKFGPIAAFGIEESALALSEKIFLAEHVNLLKTTRKELTSEASQSAPRDRFAIFAVKKEEKLRVIDGNRRLLQAIIAGEKIIRAFVGEPTAEPMLFEHWVPTSLLVDLVFWHKRQAELKRKTTDITARVIAELIRDSSIARSEFANRAIHRDDKVHMILAKGVADALADYKLRP